MILTHKVKLLPNEERRTALQETMGRFNAACGFVSVAAFRTKSANMIRLQKEVYHEIRDRFSLPEQPAVRAIAEECEAYDRDGTRNTSRMCPR